jgi:hypothetical protein
MGGTRRLLDRSRHTSKIRNFKNILNIFIKLPIYHIYLLYESLTDAFTKFNITCSILVNANFILFLKDQIYMHDGKMIF